MYLGWSVKTGVVYAMNYIVQPGDSLWRIAHAELGNGSKWQQIAHTNGINSPYHLFAGQELIIRQSSNVGLHVQQDRTPLQARKCFSDSSHYFNSPDSLASTTSFIPAAAYVFVLADEINPLSGKVVRRVITNPKMAEDLARNLQRPMTVFNNPEKYGFTPTDPTSKLPPGRHAQGMKPSPYSSASSKILGEKRFKGQRFWIDVTKAEIAGATFHSTDEILDDLDRIIAKARSASDVEKLQVYKDLVAADREVLVKGSVPPSAVKGSYAMAGTRALQGVQIIGFTMSAVNLAHATEKSMHQNSANPLIAESIRQVGGWGAAWAGMKLGAAGGALLGVSTGPGAVVTGAVGSVAGGFAGYFGFDWIADHIDEN